MTNKRIEQVLDYADPNHPTDFWRKQRAKDRLYADMLEIIGDGRQILVQVGNEEYLNGGYISAWELRQKLNDRRQGKEMINELQSQ